jgi:aspartyl-tRNA(Asn)/glutamyl-tRNA(Gln) amidotransferase subunit A
VNWKYDGLSAIQAVKAGEISCLGITQWFIQKAKSDQDLNAWMDVFEESALARAQSIDDRLNSGEYIPLAGMVIGIKDVLCYAEHPVSAGSQILKGFNSLFTATSVQRLLDAGVIVLGRLNCDEFAMGSSNENSSYGPVKNPLDRNRVPGGSSGGSAAAVAAGMCHATLGTDTGGSIRQPAAFCGIVGLKPTYGRVSRYGMVAYASSFDQIGPMSHTIEDSALLLQYMSGFDPNDATSSSHLTEAYSDLLNLPGTQKFTIGVIRENLEMPGLDPQIKQATLDILDKLKAQGHQIKEVSFPYLDYVVPTYYVLTTAEASSNLSRYDGIRFGYRTSNAKNIEEVYVKSRSEGFGPEVKRRIMLGTFVLSAGYYDAYYTKGMQVRHKIKDATVELLKGCDFLFSPTTPTPAFAFGEKSKDPISMYLSDIFTVHANLSGHPAISVPFAGHSSGLPFGIHILGDYFSESKLLGFSRTVMELNINQKENA